jgi:hypothetical protein
MERVPVRVSVPSDQLADKLQQVSEVADAQAIEKAVGEWPRRLSEPHTRRK